MTLPTTRPMITVFDKPEEDVPNDASPVASVCDDQETARSAMGTNDILLPAAITEKTSFDNRMNAQGGI